MFGIVCDGAERYCIIISRLTGDRIGDSRNGNNRRGTILAVSILLTLKTFAFTFKPTGTRTTSRGRCARKRRCVNICRADGSATGTRGRRNKLISGGRNTLNMNTVSVNIRTRTKANAVAVNGHLTPSTRSDIFVNSGCSTRGGMCGATDSGMMSVNTSSGTSKANSITLNCNTRTSISGISNGRGGPSGRDRSVTVNCGTATGRGGVTVNTGSITASTTSGRATGFQSGASSSCGTPSSCISINSDALGHQVAGMTTKTSRGSITAIKRLGGMTSGGVT